MLRAVGLRRASLVGAFALEGWCYALVSAIAGTFVGLALGRGLMAAAVALVLQPLRRRPALTALRVQVGERSTGHGGRVRDSPRHDLRDEHLAESLQHHPGDPRHQRTRAAPAPPPRVLSRPRRRDRGHLADSARRVERVVLRVDARSGARTRRRHSDAGAQHLRARLRRRALRSRCSCGWSSPFPSRSHWAPTSTCSSSPCRAWSSSARRWCSLPSTRKRWATPSAASVGVRCTCGSALRIRSHDAFARR